MVGGFDMADKALVLPCHIAFTPVIVQSCFAYTHHFRMGCMGYQFGYAKFFSIGVIRMNAYGGINRGVRFGNG